MLVAGTMVVQSLVPVAAKAADPLTNATTRTYRYVNKQQDVRMVALMTDYVRLSAILAHLKFATTTGASVNGISDPDMQMLAKSGVIAIDLTGTAWAVLKTYANGKSIYTNPANLGKRFEHIDKNTDSVKEVRYKEKVNAASDAFNRKTRAGQTLARVQSVAGAATWTAIWGAGVFYYWRNISPVLFLQKEDFDAVLKMTESDLAVVESQLSEQARVQLGLAPRAESAKKDENLFKVD